MSWLPQITLLHSALFMSFVALAAIPIVLHLLTLHRLKTVELSTYRFLFDSYVQQRRRTQFLEALLAALRALFLLLLILTLARPVVEHWGGLFHAGGSGREVVMLVDCSASMDATTAGESAFDRAKKAALSVAERLDKNDRLTLIRVVSTSQEVFSRFSADVEQIKEKINGLQTSPARGNMLAALMGVFGPEAPPRENPMVYLFTDCQQSGWNEVQSQGLERIIPNETPFIVVNVGSNQPLANVALIGNTPRSGRAIVGLPVFLHPRVANYSTRQADVEVAVFIDEKEIARNPMALKPADKTTSTVIYYPTEPGVHRGRFEVTCREKALDQFPADNNFLFTLNVVPPLKVLLVNGNPTNDPLDSETLYLRLALESIHSDASAAARVDRSLAALSPGQGFGRALDVQEITEGMLNPENLRDASVVMLADCGQLNQTHFTWLRDYVHGGGGLLLFPGERVNPDFYNQQFFAVPGPQDERLTGVQLGHAGPEAQRADQLEHLGGMDSGHPVLAVFDEAKANYFKNVYFSRHVPLTWPTTEHSNGTVLAEFASGEPAVVESRFGEGVVMVAAFPATPHWTNLPLKPEFPPLILRLVSYAQHRPAVHGPSRAIHPGDTVEITAAESLQPITIHRLTVEPIADRLRARRGNRAMELSFEPVGQQLVAAFGDTEERGYYTAEVGNTQRERENIAFAVNLASEESDFRTIGEEQFRKLLPGAQLTFVDASAQAQQQNGRLGTSKDEIWRPLIYLLFAIITVEFLIATLRGGRRATAEDLSMGERIRRYNPGSWIGRMTGAARNS